MTTNTPQPQTMTTTPTPETLKELYNHPDFQPFGSTSDDWINDGERMERCQEAAEHGADGSTHYEVIQDWREFLSNLFRDLRRHAETDEEEANIEQLESQISGEIDACEAHHEQAGTLHASRA